jgi:hypothetical protein
MGDFGGFRQDKPGQRGKVLEKDEESFFSLKLPKGKCSKEPNAITGWLRTRIPRFGIS